MNDQMTPEECQEAAIRGMHQDLVDAIAKARGDA